MHVPAALIPCFGALLASAASAVDLKPMIDNERVLVWDVPAGQSMPGPVVRHEYDVVRVSFARNMGSAVFEPKGGASSSAPNSMRTLVIALKDHPVPALPNTSGFSDAFPRPGVKKLLDNDRIATWEYTWLPGKPTPMHFHSRDVVLVYLDDGSLQSTTPDGQNVVNDYSYGQIRFNPRNRAHFELLVKGSQHAIMTELK